MLLRANRVSRAIGPRSKRRRSSSARFFPEGPRKAPTSLTRSSSAWSNAGVLISTHAGFRQGVLMAVWIAVRLFRANRDSSWFCSADLILLGLPVRKNIFSVCASGILRHRRKSTHRRSPLLRRTEGGSGVGLATGSEASCRHSNVILWRNAPDACSIGRPTEPSSRRGFCRSWLGGDEGRPLAHGDPEVGARNRKLAVRKSLVAAVGLSVILAAFPSPARAEESSALTVGDSEAIGPTHSESGCGKGRGDG
jgi:hypothetical protein